MPAGLRRLDDRWGLTWRVRHRLREIDPARSLRMQLARLRTLDLDRPIFIVGAPRSGTTTLFRLLGAHPDLRSLGHEGHDCWRHFHHPRRDGWQSDALDAADVTSRERSFVHRWFYARLGDGRFVEKTPENAMRIPYLLELFPRAHVVWAKRDPEATLRSMLNGWRDANGTFRSYYVPEELHIPGLAADRRWCFGLVHGWRDLRDAPLPEVVAEQWRQHVGGALAGRQLVAPERWHEVKLEDLVSAPDTTVSDLLEGLELAEAPSVLAHARELRERRENVMPRQAAPADADVDDVAVILRRLRSEITASGYAPS